MTADATRTAQTADFVSRTDAFRGELLAHCYRMTGSMHDAEDVVQETYVRAWRAYDRFEGRSSVRLWLYRIATRACLTALEGRARRPLPSGLGAPSDDHRVPVAAGNPDVPWLEPAPDLAMTGTWGDPAAVIASRAGIRLAFVAALQALPARQRAVLILRDVLTWKAVEVAEILGTTPTAVNSALLRARATLRAVAVPEDDVAEPDDPGVTAQLDRFVAAFEDGDVAALVELLRADAEFEMPPVPTWFTGRDAVGGFLAEHVLPGPGRWRLLPTRANAGPAFAVYSRADDGGFVAYGIQSLTFAGTRVSRIVMFRDAALVARFGMALTLSP